VQSQKHFRGDVLRKFSLRDEVSRLLGIVERLPYAGKTYEQVLERIDIFPHFRRRAAEFVEVVHYVLLLRALDGVVSALEPIHDLLSSVSLLHLRN
jgi:hypothetical protein